MYGAHRFGGHNRVQVIKACESPWVVNLKVLNNSLLDDADGMVWLPAAMPNLYLHCSQRCRHSCIGVSLDIADTAKHHHPACRAVCNRILIGWPHAVQAYMY